MVGATWEVGAAIVARLRKAGVPVVAVARDSGHLEQLTATDDGITACQADIGDDSSGEAIAVAVSGPVRMVVQPAAVPPAGPLATIEPDALGKSVSLKLGGLLRLIRAVEDGSPGRLGPMPSGAFSVPNHAGNSQHGRVGHHTMRQVADQSGGLSHRSGEMGCSEYKGLVAFAICDIDHHNLFRPGQPRTLDGAATDAAAADHHDGVARAYLGGVDR